MNNNYLLHTKYNIFLSNKIIRKEIHVKLNNVV